MEKSLRHRNCVSHPKKITKLWGQRKCWISGEETL